MSDVASLDAIRRQGILASLAGFPILLVFGVAWLIAGALSYAVPPVGPFVLAVLFGLRALHLTGFLVGAALLAGAAAARAHARAVWRASPLVRRPLISSRVSHG